MKTAGLPLIGAAWMLAAIVFALTGCASTPQATEDRDAEAKQFITHPGSATLYVYRPDFATREMDETVLYVDNRLIGATLAGTYFRIDVRAGTNLLHGYGYDQGRLRIDTLSGEIYFVSLNVRNGTSNFARVSPDAGKRLIARCCVLMENWAPGQRPLLR